MPENPDTSKNKMWGGRFADGPAAIMEDINVSIEIDKRLWREDIAGSKAHAAMLSAQKIITSDDEAAIAQGLDKVAQEIESGAFPFSRTFEDIHMNIEARLKELIGEPASRLHTGRSRNDQVATDFRLWMRDTCDAATLGITALQKALIEKAETHASSVMPGYTHLQIAQPVTFGHHCLAYVEMLERDKTRFADARARLNECPLGAAALAGTSFPIDRDATAKALGFDRPMANSLDAVSARDFALEVLSAASICASHLSRLAEEIVLWTSPHFSFAKLTDAFSTGSSIMPQKKNPDVPELVRGKTGRVNGHLMGLLTLMKGQPLAYNKDNQEDKEPLFDTVDTVHDCLRAFADMVPAIVCKAEAMRAATMKGFATATDLADYLVRKGMPFRDAHEVVGSAVAYGVEHSLDLADIDLPTLQGFSALIGDDVYEFLTLEGALAARDHLGGTAPKQVLLRVAEGKQALTTR